MHGDSMAEHGTMSWGIRACRIGECRISDQERRGMGNNRTGGPRQSFSLGKRRAVVVGAEHIGMLACSASGWSASERLASFLRPSWLAEAPVGLGPEPCVGAEIASCPMSPSQTQHSVWERQGIPDSLPQSILPLCSTAGPPSAQSAPSSKNSLCLLLSHPYLSPFHLIHPVVRDPLLQLARYVLDSRLVR